MPKKQGTTFDNQAGLTAIQAQGRRRKPNAEPAGGGGGGWAAHNRKQAERRIALQRDSLPGGLTFQAIGNFDGAGRSITGTSIFDPVLCELAYRWFCPPGGLVLDPFAGGSVRGIVASKLGRGYIGVDLRPEQVEANRQQAKAICTEEPFPVWHVGDSREIGAIAAGVQADFLFSCPPYANLEVYSDDPADLSTMAYPAFREAYFAVVAGAAKLLRPNRFACFVVGEVRGKDGGYLGFLPDTVEAFRRAGLTYYGEAILVTAAGSLPIRAGKQFEVARKFGKTHQNVLLFVRGDARAATAAIGPVEAGPFDDETADDGLVNPWGDEDDADP